MLPDAGHRHSRCFRLRECAVNRCKEKHHPMLHQDQEIKIKHITESAQNDQSDKKHCLLQLMRLRAGFARASGINVMWGSGATVSMVTFKKARELGLSGARVKITIVKVGAEKETVESRIYEVPISDT